MRIGYWKQRQKCGGKLYMFGGDKQQNTTSTATNTDARAVTTDSYNTSNYDLSNRSSNLTSNAWTDASTSNSNNTTNADFSNRSVNTSTTNSTTNADFSNRSITSNAWADSSNSNNTTTTNADFSNRSTDNSQTNSNNTYDLSNRSVSNVDSRDLSTTTTNNAWTDARSTSTTTNTDNRNQSVNYTTTNSLDAGAVTGALNFAGKAMTGALDQVQSALGFAAATVAGDQANVVHAYDYAGGLFDAATNAADKSSSRAYDAFDRAAQIEASALAMTGASAKTALDQVQNAYADAKGTTQAQQKIMLAVLAVAGVAVLARAKG